MTIREITAILGLDRSTISKIVNGHVNGSAASTVHEVMLLISLKEKYFDEIFKMDKFVKLCDVVINQSTTRDSKNLIKVIEHACHCRSKHETLLNPNEGMTLQELLGKYYEDSEKLIKNELFGEMCEIAIKKEPELRSFASKLRSYSIALINSKNKADAVSK